MKYKIINFDIKGDDRGALISLESSKNIPFDIKRVYYIFGTKIDVRRGFHAHTKLQQLLVCTSGSCEVLLDDGKEKCIIRLDHRNKGLIIKDMIWHEMFNFSSDCVLMVLADDYYNEEDYIRDYNEFIKLVVK